MIDKLPFFFSFDGDEITSLSQADKPVEGPICSAFGKYVRGVFETGRLALYERKISEVINKRKMYTDDKNSDNDNDRNE